MFPYDENSAAGLEHAYGCPHAPTGCSRPQELAGTPGDPFRARLSAGSERDENLAAAIGMRSTPSTPRAYCAIVAWCAAAPTSKRVTTSHERDEMIEV